MKLIVRRKMLSVLAAAAIMLATLFAALPTTSYADYYTSSKTLRPGMTGSYVKELQQDLKTLGYFTYSTTTGYFGSITRDAVVRYQKAKKLVVDGIVGSATRRKIKADMIVKTAYKYLGVPYVWGGTSPKGFDCSGLTHYVMLENEIAIPRTVATQDPQGTAVAKSELQPGDFVFFNTSGSGPSHVGISVGSGKFIHASSGSKKVVVSELSNAYFAAHYIGAKRMV